MRTSSELRERIKIFDAYQTDALELLADQRVVDALGAIGMYEPLVETTNELFLPNFSWFGVARIPREYRRDYHDSNRIPFIPVIKQGESVRYDLSLVAPTRQMQETAGTTLHPQSAVQWRRQQTWSRRQQANLSGAWHGRVVSSPTKTRPIMLMKPPGSSLLHEAVHVQDLICSTEFNDEVKTQSELKARHVEAVTLQATGMSFADLNSDIQLSETLMMQFATEDDPYPTNPVTIAVLDWVATAQDQALSSE